MSSVVIYHRNCWDGLAAAWAAKLTLKGEVKFVPCQYGDQVPTVSASDDVYILDFSFKREDIISLKSKCSNLLVLDHHKSAEESLRGLPYCRFDMSRSGAKMAAEHFNIDPKFIPLINYIEDRDLWNWDLPHSKEFSNGLRSYPMDFSTLDKVASGAITLRQLISEGSAIGRSIDSAVKLTAKHARRAKWSTGDKDVEIDTVVTNCTSNISEVGNYLCEKYRVPFSMTYIDTLASGRIWSLRSSGSSEYPEGFDVSEVAKKYGGGGHRNASGFVSEKLPDLRFI